MGQINSDSMPDMLLESNSTWVAVRLAYDDCSVVDFGDVSGELASLDLSVPLNLLWGLVVNDDSSLPLLSLTL